LNVEYVFAWWRVKWVKTPLDYIDSVQTLTAPVLGPWGNSLAFVTRIDVFKL